MDTQQKHDSFCEAVAGFGQSNGGCDCGVSRRMVGEFKEGDWFYGNEEENHHIGNFQHKVNLIDAVNKFRRARRGEEFGSWVITNTPY